MALLRWILALPFIAGAVWFALAHPQSVSVMVNPVKDPIELPLYFVVLLFLAIGFIFGAFMAWIGMGKTRQERRAFKKEVKNLNKEIEVLKNEKMDLIVKQDKPQLTSNATDIIEG